MQFPFHIILASKSPRRSQLLTQAGLPFSIKTKEVAEDYPADMPVAQVPVFLAEKKARASLDVLTQPTDVLLAADSVVILDGKIYGKPQNTAEARAMLRQLSGREHQVITGVALFNQAEQRSFGDVAHVKFGELSDADIDFYIKNYQPFDKAGSYAIQEWIGLCKIEWIKGTYANVMGLPVQRVWNTLAELYPQ
ncbi:MAG: Maf family nucleotide pyrophosphatase [Bacteroidota bacterium]